MIFPAVLVFLLTVWILRRPRLAGRLLAEALRFSASRRTPNTSFGVDPGSAMTRTRAAAILGVPATATAAEARIAYLRLIRFAHPDHGGTSGLAAELNAARDAFGLRARS